MEASATFDELRDAVATLPKTDQARLLSVVAVGISDTVPGITYDPEICGGRARIVRSRIPVWTLEAARRQGLNEAEILNAYPTLRAEDLVNAWSYVRANREEIDREIDENDAA